MRADVALSFASVVALAFAACGGNATTDGDSDGSGVGTGVGTETDTTTGTGTSTGTDTGLNCPPPTSTGINTSTMTACESEYFPPAPSFCRSRSDASCPGAHPIEGTACGDEGAACEYCTDCTGADAPSYDTPYRYGCEAGMWTLAGLPTIYVPPTSTGQPSYWMGCPCAQPALGTDCSYGQEVLTITECAYAGGCFECSWMSPIWSGC